MPRRLSQGLDTPEENRKLKSGPRPEGTLFIMSLVVHNNDPFSPRFLFAKMLR